MAKAYLYRLSQLVDELGIAEAVDFSLETKHFFSGAALYANGTICASWSPVGLAFKLPKDEVSTLIAEDRAKPLRYFAKGHVKEGYALFEDPDIGEVDRWRKYFIAAVENATNG